MIMRRGSMSLSWKESQQPFEETGTDKLKPKSPQNCLKIKMMLIVFFLYSNIYKKISYT